MSITKVTLDHDKKVNIVGVVLMYKGYIVRGGFTSHFLKDENGHEAAFGACIREMLRTLSEKVKEDS